MTASSSADNSRRDRAIPWYFVTFFLAIAVIDGIFVTLAVTTQSGTVTERAYEKGLDYDEVLDTARAQKNLGITQAARYENGTISWRLTDRDGRPLSRLQVRANLLRPTMDGHDFEIEMSMTEEGLYTANPDFPLPGAWIARLEATWQNPQSQTRRYSTRLELVAP